MVEIETGEWFGDAPDPREGPGPALRFVVESVLIVGLALRTTAHLLTHTVGHYRDPEDVPHPLDVTWGLGLGPAIRDPVLTAREDLHCRYGAFAFGVLCVPLFSSGTYFDWTPALGALAAANGAVLVADPLLWVGHQLRRRIAGSVGAGARAQTGSDATSESD